MRLDGRPGVYSARYGGEDLPHPEKIKLLLSELQDTPPQQRGARYECAIHFVLADGRKYAFHADCPGVIGYETRGQNGFGYDPIFYIGERSFAEYSDEEKDRISHRGKALRQMAETIGRLVESGEIRVTTPNEKGEE